MNVRENQTKEKNTRRSLSMYAFQPLLFLLYHVLTCISSEDLFDDVYITFIEVVVVVEN